MKSKLTRTLLAGVAVATLGFATPVLAAPAADGMPRDLIAEGSTGNLVQTASDDSEMKAEKERETYLEETGRKLDETGERVANSEFGEDVQDAWDEVQVQWDSLSAATAETWDDAREAFENSWDDFEEEWDEATKD